jgi:hypothetical protein
MQTFKTTRTYNPEHPQFSDFRVGDMVSTRFEFENNIFVSPVRRFEEVQEIGIMMLHGKWQPAIKVMGLPYHPWELKLDLAWIE